ncbi:AbrB/MazE/SpoVT family DNA-binding domain-containing protein [Sandaracinobacteroides saxicola]|uniref:AbrB/MazE/SpoVT family DNA-binding domain-containing protein n=1 Tax=Sandaracinobacteroides saxicola TaxID=2759707 RepID=A0A7G5IGN2_9SPHN|nr:AbrB/MazE/SpoVT family DNA-binding domain-containing protein [Sandaracinobacteroides saxicola]QMW22524.1 AbrB/MazE/SpoVT family DNA-binding domain-containing protein [Sandaracinobacteroides saxicola]
MEAIRTNAFQTGNSVAVRLPKSLGVRPGDMFEVSRNGPFINLHAVADPEHERAEIAALVAELRALGPMEDADPEDGRIELPDRPGLS